MLTNNIFKSLLELIKTVAIVFIIVFVLKTYLIQTYKIEGQSMEPSFHNNEYLLVDKLSYRIHPPQRGDVVILIPPVDAEKNYIKRIIGLPGDIIEISDGKVLVNGKTIIEPYLKSGEKTLASDSTSTTQKIYVKTNEYFVLGDNRDNSRDSRSIGSIPSQNIVGKTQVVILPFNDFGLVHHQNYLQPTATTQ